MQSHKHKVESPEGSDASSKRERNFCETCGDKAKTDTQ